MFPQNTPMFSYKQAKAWRNRILWLYIFDNIDKSNDVYYIYIFYLALYYFRKEDLLKALSICNISIIETRFSSKLFFLNMIYYLKGLILYKLENYRLSQQNFNKALLLSEISGCI